MAGTSSSRDWRVLDWLRPAGLMILCWLPLIVIAWPGSVCPDYVYQIEQALGVVGVTNHHPVLSTWLFGGLFSAGRAVAGAAGGIAVTVMFQTLAMALTLGLFVAWFGRMGLSVWPKRLLLAFFCLCPLFPMYAQWCVKDSLSSAVVGLVALQLLVRVWAQKTDEKLPPLATLPALLAASLLAALLRNNQIYVLVPTLAALCLGRRGERRLAVLGTCAGLFVLFALWSAVLLPRLGFPGSNIREAMSVPTQQTSVFLREHPDDLSDQERAALEACTDVPLTTLAQSYNPEVSDPVKNHFVFESGELMAYLRAWLSMGLRDPGLYLRTFWEACCGYLNPFCEYSYFREVARCGERQAPENIDFSGIPEGEPLFAGASSCFPGARRWANDAVVFLYGIPVLGLLLRPATYCLLALALTVVQLVRRRGCAPLAVAGVLTVLVCCASPLNGSMRYALPLIYLVPCQLVGFVCLGADARDL
ncbi:MAG: DUF6020 family protein [Coriobacteriales bacterium]|nr:DUF6020 family protein [Coriobacteriales bacterium]